MCVAQAGIVVPEIGLRGPDWWLISVPWLRPKDACRRYGEALLFLAKQILENFYFSLAFPFDLSYPLEGGA